MRICNYLLWMGIETEIDRVSAIYILFLCAGTRAIVNVSGPWCEFAYT